MCICVVGSMHPVVILWKTEDNFQVSVLSLWVPNIRHPQKHPYPLHQCLKSGTFVSKVGSASELLLASDEVIHHLIHTVSLLIIFPHLYIIHCLIIFSGEYFANTCMRIPALVLLLRNMTLDIPGSMPDTC